MQPIKKIIFIIFLVVFPLSGFSEIKSRSWEYYYSKGKIQFNSEMYDYAIYNLQTAMQLNPRLHEAANLLAEIYLRKNQKRKALEYFTASLKINDQQQDIYNNSGELHEYFGNYSLSFEHFQKAIKINPLHTRANLHVSRYYLKQDNKAQASKHFRISYTEGDKICAKYFIKGIHAAKKAESYIKGNYHEAIKYYSSMHVFSEKKIKQINTYIEDHKRDFNYEAIERLHYKLAVIYFKRALYYYQMTIDVSPAKIEAYINISLIFRKLNMFSEAIEYLNKLAYIKPDNEQAHTLLGNLYYTRKIPGKRELYLNLAIKHLQQALIINPGNDENRLLLAQIYYRTGKKDQAWELQDRINLLKNKAYILREQAKVLVGKDGNKVKKLTKKAMELEAKARALEDKARIIKSRNYK